MQGHSGDVECGDWDLGTWYLQPYYCPGCRSPRVFLSDPCRARSVVLVFPRYITNSLFITLVSRPAFPDLRALKSQGRYAI